MTTNATSTTSTTAAPIIFKQGGRTYESRLNDCGNLKCRRCGGAGPRHPSHGPYWYLCVCINSKWVRIYLGKQLDTARFVDQVGGIDWEAVKQFRARKSTIVVPNPSKLSWEPPTTPAAASS
jgi:hypothetical protein